MKSHKLKSHLPQTEASLQPTIIGKAIIYCRPEVRNIDEKTANFFVRSGSEFESGIQQNEVKDFKFNSRNVNDFSNGKEKGESERGKGMNKIMQPASMPPSYGKVVIVKDYDPKQKATKIARPDASEEYLISPLTGERIAASKIQQHMRIGLLDPRWMEQRDKDVHAKLQETVFAPGSAIEDSLKQLAERRTDIFGVGDVETSIGKKIGEEDKKKDDNVTWDGHMSSVDAATRAARVNITLEEQIHQIHKMKGLVPDEEKEKIGPKPVSRPSELLYNTTAASNSQPEPPAMTIAPVSRHSTSAKSPFMLTPPLKEDELLLKKFRTEDSFIPEQQFLARNHGLVHLRIKVPFMADKSDWKLNGQTLTITSDPSDTVSVIKTRILEQTGMATGKQKLQYNGLFLKDNNSLAYYNIISGNVINLQQKERGGRRK